MKNQVVVLMCFLLSTTFCFAQAPQGIPYQAIARDISGNPLVSQGVSFRFAIHDQLPNGTVVFSEIHNTITNEFGLVNVVVGNGIPITGALADVDWSNGSKFFQVEFDPAGGSSFTDMGTTQMMSVPYALHSGSSDLINLTSVPSDFSCMTVAATVATGNNTDSSPNSVAVAGSHAFVVNVNDDTMQTIDISNPASPSIVATISSGGDWPWAVAVSGNYAYIVNLSTNNLQIIDIADPTSPVAMGSVTTDTTPYAIAVAGNFAYVVNQNSNTVQVIDVSNPASPNVIGSAATLNNPFSIAVVDNHAYVANTDALYGTGSSLQIFDITNPALPVSVGSINSGPWSNSVAVNGTHAYVTNWSDNSLQVFDISNPTAPQLSATVATDTGPYFVTIAGNYALLTVWNDYFNPSSQGMQIIDISNPASPVALNTVDTGAVPSSIAVSGNYAYVANRFSANVQVISLTPCTAAIVVDPITGEVASQSIIPLWNSTGDNINNANSGSVGIGTNNPNGVLHINQNNTADELVVGENIWNANDVASRIQLGNSNSSSFLRAGQAADRYASIGWVQNANPDLAYVSVLAINGANPVVLQRDGGNVGIGTTAPWRKLQVEGGDARINGVDIGQGLATGLGNVHVGGLENNSTGAENTAVGEAALASNMSGNSNTAVGLRALINNQAGNENTSVGIYSSYNTLGSGNTALGNRALELNVEGNNNTALGNGADVMSTNLENATAIGYNAKVGASNSLVLGNEVNVGIGTSTPLADLHIRDEYALIQLDDADDGSSLVILPPDPTGNGTGGIGTTTYHDLPLFTDNQDRVTIKADGRVGIGTVVPGAKLDISGNLRLTDGTQGAGKVLTSDANGFASWQSLNSASQWSTNGSSIYNNNAGNVGIGTSTPADRLSISGSGNEAISVRSSVGNYTVRGGIKFGTTNPLFQDQWAGILSWSEGGADQASLSFYTSYGTRQERMFIAETGEIGIGTNSPSRKLHIETGADQVYIHGTGNNNQFNTGGYPLFVDAGYNGIMIRTYETVANSGNNFMSFIDGDYNVNGRIEGQTYNELVNSDDYYWFTTFNELELAFNFAMSLACDAQLDLAESGVHIYEFSVVASQWLVESDDMISDQGVSFASGYGDYAEYLERVSNEEEIKAGDIVGVFGGKISKNTDGASQLMVVSTAPIVLGNMPDAGKEADYEKVAFMGQVPVRVHGTVHVGDYVLSSGRNDGYGIGVNPADMQIADYARIVGVAWSEFTYEQMDGLVNVAVGINNNDLVSQLTKQQKQIDELTSGLNTIAAYMQSKDPSFRLDLPKATANGLETSGISQSNVNTSTAKDAVTLSPAAVESRKQFVPKCLASDEAKAYFLEQEENLLVALEDAKKRCIEKGIDPTDSRISHMFSVEYYRNMLNSK